MSDNRTIQQIADEQVAKVLADFDARQRAGPQAPVQSLADQLAQVRFAELATNECLIHDVKPRAVHHAVRELAEHFELKDDALVPKHGATDPSDPLLPLSPAAFLRQLKAQQDFLFQHNPERGVH